MAVHIKRIYAASSASDGYRVLIDRIWPRGISKEEAELDEWQKDIAPSTELRQWYGHQAALFTEFKERYTKELDANTAAVAHLEDIIRDYSVVTMLYAAHDSNISNAAVLLEYLTKK